MECRSAGIEKQFSFQRSNQDAIRLHPILKAFQGREGCWPILVCAGEGFLESVVARDNGGRACDLLIALLDKLHEDLRAGAQPGVDFRHGVPAIGLADHEIASALQESQQRDKKYEQPAPEPAESKFQG